jgi:hypothetical protein
MNVPLIGVCLVGCFFIKDRGLQRPDEVQVAVADEETVQAQDEASNEEMVEVVAEQPSQGHSVNASQETIQTKAQ